MIIDGITLAAAVIELHSLYGAKIEKIYQPARDAVLLQLHSGEGKKRLLISASGSDCRIHLTEAFKTNPQKAPNFCMVLRKHLVGGRIANIMQFGLDRIVHIRIEARDEMGFSCVYTLAAELMGKYSNIILLDTEEKILDSIRHVSLDTSSIRQVLPGKKYALPETDKIDPLATDKSELAALLANVELPYGIVKKIQGVSPAIAKELVYTYFGEAFLPVLAGKEIPGFAAHMQNYIERAVCRPNPCLQTNMEELPVFFSALPCGQYPAEKRKCFSSVNAMIDAFYTMREAVQTLESARSDLLKIIGKDIARVEKKLKIQLETVQAGEDAKKFFAYGELLSANLYRLKKGAAAAQVFNYYTNGDILIPLDPSLSPAQNAGRYYKRASKMKKGAVVAKTRAATYAEELEFLRALEYDLLTAADKESLQETRATLVKYGYIQTEAKHKPAERDPLEAPKRFCTSGGFLVLAGKNSRQNDVLTTKIASEKELWFHAKNMPGSHVLLFTKGKDPSETDILEAAVIAATLSRGKDAGKVTVDYTKKANVWKQKGARPGMVLYKNQRSLQVVPDPALLAEMEEKAAKNGRYA